MTDKHYYRHSGFPGNLKDLTLAEIIKKDPSLAISHAVAGIIPKNKLAPERLKRLKIFPSTEHAHTAQQPKEIK
jgi:large subunit ribosomal protein L13